MTSEETPKPTFPNRNNSIIITPKQLKALDPNRWAFLELMLAFRGEYKKITEVVSAIAGQMGMSYGNAMKYWQAVKPLFQLMRRKEVLFVAISRTALRENMAKGRWFPFGDDV